MILSIPLKMKKSFQRNNPLSHNMRYVEDDSTYSIIKNLRVFGVYSFPHSGCLFYSDSISDCTRWIKSTFPRGLVSLSTGELISNPFVIIPFDSVFFPRVADSSTTHKTTKK